MTQEVWVAPLFLEYWPDMTTAFEIFLANIHWVLIGTLVGMFFGLVPGMGGIVGITILLPFTLSLNQFEAFAMLTGVVGATSFAGSITGILISTPGTISNAASMLDGYPMSQQGEANRAIGASATASAAGAAVAVVAFILLIPILLDVALMFGPPEQFWLMVWAVLVIPFLVGDRPFLGAAIGLFGGLLALIGRSPQTGGLRFTFDQLYLWDGLQLLPVFIGMFALAELIKLSSEKREMIVPDDVKNMGSRIQGIRDVYTYRWTWLRGALIGFFFGVLPGVGSSAASFVSYASAVQSSKNSEKFGKGAVEGVIAPEASNDAKDGGQLIPTLGLGIPGSGIMAVFLGAMVMHGITPSPLIIANNLHLVFVISFSLIASNFLTSAIGLLFTNQITKMLEVPVPRLLPVITVLAVAATFIVRNSFLDVFTALVFGVFGLVLIYLNISRIPFVIAFILIGSIEYNFTIAYQLGGRSVYGALFGSPLSTLLAILVVGSVILSATNLKSRIFDLFQKNVLER